MLSAELEDKVVLLPGLCEVLLRVVDDLVCAERPDHFKILHAAYACHMPAEILGELYRKGSDAAGGADDQDPVAASQLAAVSQAPQGGKASKGYCSRKVETQRARFLRDLGLRRTQVL